MPQWEGLLRYDCINERYSDDDLKERFGLNKKEKIADGYGHHNKCIWFVQECKTKGTKRAIEQLTSTVRQLREKAKPVNRIFYIADRIPKSENTLYRVNDGKIISRINGKIIKIENIEVEYIPTKELTGARVEWLFT